MMLKYLGHSIDNKRVAGDWGKAESVQNFLIIYLKRANSKTYNKFVKVQSFLSTPSMKTFNERVLWYTLYKTTMPNNYSTVVSINCDLTMDLTMWWANKRICSAEMEKGCFSIYIT